MIGHASIASDGGMIKLQLTSAIHTTTWPMAVTLVAVRVAVPLQGGGRHVTSRDRASLQCHGEAHEYL